MQNLSCENDFFIIMQIKLIFTSGFALGLVLRVRVFGTRKWSINPPLQSVVIGYYPGHFSLSNAVIFICLLLKAVNLYAK